MKRRFRNMLYTFVVIGICLLVGICLILSQAKFGKHPHGKSLERVQQSSHYVNGEFTNTVPTAIMAKGQSTIKILWNGFFSKQSRLRPEHSLPTVKVNFDALPRNEDTVIWLGHSSYFIQLGGKRILVDPVFSDHGAPFSFLNKTFPGTDLYTAADMPQIDLLLISHDHWDHLDYQSVTNLLPKVQRVVVPLGIGAHFIHWGYPTKKLHEADWNTSVSLEGGLTVYVVPARHYSGRLFDKNKTLWAGFVLETPEHRIFLSGDTGYGPHFADIADTFKTFDLVALDGGQYDARWPLIHMTPEQAAQAAEELGTRYLLMGHVGRFSIAAHAWDEPFIRAIEACKDRPFHLLTPRIGEAVWLNGTEQHFSRWWEGIR